MAGRYSVVSKKTGRKFSHAETSNRDYVPPRMQSVLEITARRHESLLESNPFLYELKTTLREQTPLRKPLLRRIYESIMVYLGGN